MAKPWKCPFCGSQKHEALEQKTTGVWFVRCKCKLCDGSYTVSKHGTREDQGPDPLKIINIIGQQMDEEEARQRRTIGESMAQKVRPLPD